MVEMDSKRAIKILALLGLKDITPEQEQALLYAIECIERCNNV